MKYKDIIEYMAVISVAFAVSGCIGGDDDSPVVAPENSTLYNADKYTKIDATGNELPDSATEWSCVRDNTANIMWENKTNDNGLHDKNNTYTWYDVNSTDGEVGVQNGGVCVDASCDTSGFAEAVNTQSLCGAMDWRVPNSVELRSLVYCSNGVPSYFPPYAPGPDHGYCTGNYQIPFMIDTHFFPNTTYNTNGEFSVYYSSTSNVDQPEHAIGVTFGEGYDGYPKNLPAYVRLVRSTQ